MLPIRLILHPTDFSEYSDHAFKLACALARDHGARLLVLHVAFRPVLVAAEGVMPPEPQWYQAEVEHKLKSYVSPDSAVQVDHRMSIEDDAAEEILRVAAKEKCDLIVMGTHGRTGLSRLLMGSVAEVVVRRAPCPVLTVKLPMTEPESDAQQVEASAGKV
jgi:nucleotide-binding universal stress UspA family protein